LLITSITSHAQPYQQAKQSDPAIQFAEHIVDEKKLHYAYSGSEERPGVMFIHGTPGSWPAFETYLNDKNLQKHFFMVSIDRPGWGKSSSNDSSKADQSLSFATQAELIASVMSLYKNKKWIVVGHSLGASIAPKIALHSPTNVRSLVLLAGSLKPILGKPRWYNRLAHTLLVSWMLPGHLNYSNDEIMALRKELTLLEKELSDQKLETQVTLIQGMKDRLVSPKNASYVRETWPMIFSKVDVIELADAGHFIPWEQSSLVKDKLLELKLD
jgi:pimeloyl-ACP methyl ester carboxylesterase